MLVDYIYTYFLSFDERVVTRFVPNTLTIELGPDFNLDICLKVSKSDRGSRNSQLTFDFI